MKHCRKMKRRQRAHLGSMGTKRDTTRWRGDVGWRRDDIEERRGKGGDDMSWAHADLTKPKNEENTRGRFNCYKWTMKI
jgi:hypothetical protein